MKNEKETVFLKIKFKNIDDSVLQLFKPLLHGQVWWMV